MVESRSAKHTRTRSHGAHERTSWKAPKSVGGETESTRESTTTTCRPGVRLCSMSMCRGRANHIPAASACLPCLSLALFRTLLLRGTVVIGPRLAPRCLSVCLSVCLSGLLPFSCVPRLPSQLCVLCCPAARARTPVWHLPAELGVVAGGARRPTAWQAISLPLLSSRTVVYFRSCCSKLCFSPNAGQTMRPRSLPVLEPDIGLNLPQATHFPPTHILFRIFSSLFSAGLAICSSALAL